MIKKILLRITIFFFASSIGAVLLGKFLPIYYTPLMFMRLAEQHADGRSMKLSHTWVPIEEISHNLPRTCFSGTDTAGYAKAWKYISPCLLRPFGAKNESWRFTSIALRWATASTEPKLWRKSISANTPLRSTNANRLSSLPRCQTLSRAILPTLRDICASAADRLCD